MRDQLFKFIASLTLVCTTFSPACRDEQSGSTKPDEKPPAQHNQTKLIFPDSLRVPDEDVNMFVRSALGLCAKGDYDAFRALWSAKQEPISRAEFEEGWESVDRIEVRGLQKALLAAEDAGPQQEVYVLLVEVALDPQRKAGKRDPLREIVLMLVHEQGQWRIALAPKPMRDWIKQQGAASARPSTVTPNTANP